MVVGRGGRGEHVGSEGENFKEYLIRFVLPLTSFSTAKF